MLGSPATFRERHRHVIVLERALACQHLDRAAAWASAAQPYRLLDQTNYRKSLDQVLALLQVLNCEVDLVVRTRTA